MKKRWGSWSKDKRHNISDTLKQDILNEIEK